jgi:hypothetical protein
LDVNYDCFGDKMTELQVRTSPDEWAFVDIHNLTKSYKAVQEELLCTSVDITAYDIKNTVELLQGELNKYTSTKIDLSKTVRYDYSYDNILFVVYDNSNNIETLVYCYLDQFSKTAFTRCYSPRLYHLDIVNILENLKHNNNTMVEWHYSTKNGSCHSMVPLNNTYEIKDEYYPYINGGVKNFYDRYNNSTAPVLILLGEPGTGKTSFIRNYISHSGKRAVVTYDEAIMSSDRFLIEFLTSKESDLLIIEDADVLLASRNKDNNKHMAKFLNISDGIVKLNHKKIVFSTNLKNSNEIDSASTRPGRCFDLLNFRPLTYNEACVINSDVPFQKEFTLADVFNGKNSIEKETKVGFIR